MVTKVEDVRAIGEANRGPARSVAGRSVIVGEWLKNRVVKSALFALGDGAALVLAHIAAKAAVHYVLHIPGESLSPRGYWLFYLPFVLAVMWVLERKHSPDLRRPEKELELAVKGVSFAFLLLVCANFVVFKDTVFSRYVMVAWYVAALPLVLASRFGLRHFYSALWRRGLARRRTLLLGSAERLSEFHSLLAIQRYQAYEIVGVSPAEETWRTERSDGRAAFDWWRETARENDVEQIVVCLPRASEESHSTVLEVLNTCLPAGIDVQVYSDVFASRQFNYELDEFSGFFRFFAAPRWSQHVQAPAKRALDLAAGIAGSAIALAVLPLVGLLIKIEDPGPVFYSREFVDRDGSVRYYRKFRTMFRNAQEMLERDPELKAKFAEKHKLADDPRVTRVGKVLRRYSIDELPQFFSLFEGRLALVGPRVISRAEAGRYGEYLPKLLSVRPGLTGFWQVMGRQLTSYDERIQMDMFYVDHWSIWLDLWIVMKTFWKVIRAEGAY